MHPIVAVVVVGVVGLAALVAYAVSLPAQRTGSASVEIRAAPSRIIAVVMDVEAQTDWRPEIASVERTATGWIERTTAGETIHFSWQERSSTRLAMAFQSSAGYSGTWTAELDATTTGTLVSVVEQASVRSPLTRLLAKLFFDPEKFAANYLERLKSESEKQR